MRREWPERGVCQPADPRETRNAERLANEEALAPSGGVGAFSRPGGGLALIAEIVYAVGMTKTTTITIAEYMNALSKGSDSHERNGQFAFNLLYRLHPALADYVVGERYLDPFYNDDNLPAFFYFLVDEWDNF
jgi:hypothetical protein